MNRNFLFSIIDRQLKLATQSNCFLQPSLTKYVAGQILSIKMLSKMQLLKKLHHPGLKPPPPHHQMFAKCLGRFRTGHKIRKGTGVIINNFELNTSPAYWDDPDVFEPDRFVQRGPEAKPCIRKPEHFLPFSTGKRTCVGQQLVSGFGFVLVAGILQRYDVRVADRMCLPETSLSLPPDAHPLILTPLDGTPRR